MAAANVYRDACAPSLPVGVQQLTLDADDGMMRCGTQRDMAAMSSFNSRRERLWTLVAVPPSVQKAC